MFAVRHVSDEPLADWLATELPARARLGYDPWLHTPNQVEVFERACGKAGARAVPVDGNPIDRIWLDQPPPPITPVVPHDDELAGRPSREKREAVAETLRNDRHDAVFLAQPDAIAWLLNVRGGDVPYTPLPLAFAVLHADGRVDLFIDPRKLTAAGRAHLGDGVEIAPPQALAGTLDRLAETRKTVRIDPDGAPSWVARRSRAAGAVVAEAADPCLLPKATKTARELAGMRAAHAARRRRIDPFSRLAIDAWRRRAG